MAQELTQAAEQAPAVMQSETAAVLSLIERAARDPQVDIDKLERLFAMRERMAAEQKRTAYFAALALMQPKLPVIGKHGEIERKAKDESGAKKAAKPTKYAKWEDVVEAINPVLAEHGFALSFRIKQEQRVEVTAILSHREGHCEQTSMLLGIDDTGAKNNMQGWGSSVSYGKRYTAFALLNIVARGEDDDGKAAGAAPVITDDQVMAIRDMLEATNSDEKAFCEYMKTAKLAELPAEHYERAVAILKRKAGGK